MYNFKKNNHLFYLRHLFCRKLNEEEEEAHKRYLENIKHDEMIAKKLQDEQSSTKPQPKMTKRAKALRKKLRHKSATLDCYLSKLRTPTKE